MDMIFTDRVSIYNYATLYVHINVEIPATTRTITPQMQFGFDKSLNIQKWQSEAVNQKTDRQYIGYK
jgi:hypothetical protein